MVWIMFSFRVKLCRCSVVSFLVFYGPFITRDRVTDCYTGEGKVRKQPLKPCRNSCTL